jgi:antitoxin CptB
MTAEVRLRRLRLRCWRRGTKEMDMILGPYGDAIAEGREAADLDALESLMEENDQDLYRWVSRAEAPPPAHAGAVEALRRFHGLSAP